MEIRYVSYALANNFGDYIEINENLKRYPELHDEILKHELSHTDKKGFSKEDFLLDLAPSRVNYWKLFKFMCMYPRTFYQFLPFYYQKNKNTFFYDINLIIAWIVVIGLLTTTFIFLR
jgi:hypothetical protein